MKVIVVKDEVQGGKEAADLFKAAKQNGAKVFGLATGSTPIPMYDDLVKSDIDFTDAVSVNLDEYVGLSAQDKQSYSYYMHEHLFNAKPFKESFLPNGVAPDAESEIARYNNVLESHPIDIQVLGIGQNGHIGFNEPGASFTAKTQKVDLTESTIKANARFFNNIEDVPTQAYSMGIGSIMQAKKIVLLAFGENKADAIKGMIEGPVTEDVPASVLQNHADVTVVIDEAAASKLSK